MSERYSRLFTLPENLYAVGSPVVIAAGTLLKDNQTGKIVAQLKLRSISNKVIKAVKVNLNLFDTTGKPIGNVVEYEYLDLDAHRDSDFGQKNPVLIPEAKARSYEAAVTEVVFADRATWAATDSKWEPLPKQKTLDAVLVHAELIKQYKITVGSNFSYYPMTEKDLWYCACGALNHENENCHTCLRSLFELQTIDLDQLAKDKDARLAQEAADAEAKAAAQKTMAEATKKKTAKIFKIAIPVVCAAIAFVILLNAVIIPNSKYNKAVSLMEAGQYEDAIAAFYAMNGYKDSIQQIENCEQGIINLEFAEAEALMAAGDYDRAIAIYESLTNYEGSAEGIAAAEEGKLAVAYHAAEILAESGETVKAAIAFGKLGDYSDAHEQSFALWDTISVRNTFGNGGHFTIALQNSGKILAAGYNNYGQLNVQKWTDIQAVSTGYFHTIGMKTDGSLVSTGSNDKGRCDVQSWKNIVSISAGGYHTLGLKSDGTVLAVGSKEDNRCEVYGWRDIVAISAGGYHSVGLKNDGTVVAVGYNENGQCKVSGWQDVVAISAGHRHTVGLKSDGTVVAVGENEYGECNVSDWKDIVAVGTGWGLTVGLKSDGTVVAVGANDYGQRNVSGWRDIVAISANNCNIAALKSDGTVVVVGWNDYGQCDVSDWRDIKLPN